MEQTPTIEQAREMSDSDLNELAARLVGYRYELVTREHHGMVYGHGWTLFRPDGSSRELYVIDKYVAQEFRECIPKYIEDANWTKHLLSGLDWTVCPDEYKGKIACSIEWGKKLEYGRDHAVEEFADEILPAMVLAWVAYKLRVLAGAT